MPDVRAKGGPEPTVSASPPEQRKAEVMLPLNAHTGALGLLIHAYQSHVIYRSFLFTFLMVQGILPIPPEPAIHISILIPPCGLHSHEHIQCH